MTDYVDKANKYILDVLNKKIPACKWVRLACQRQQKDLAKKKFAYRFDRDRANKICKFMELLKHVKGPKAGENIHLEPWQCFELTTLFGWVDKKEGYRRFTQAYEEVPRGNGKSTKLSGISLYMLCADGEQGADVYSFATTRDQARIVFDDALAMARGNEKLRKAFGLTCLNNSMIILGTNSKFQPKSADAQTLDGLNTHCGLVDELHAHKTRQVFDVVKTSIGKRNQPLMFCITTAGFTLDGICMEQRRTVQKILEGSIEDDSYFGIIYTIDEGDDWKTEEAAIKANPNWGVSVTPKVVLSTLTNALVNPSAEKNYLTKHLDVWCNADTQWLQMDKWRKCYRPEVEISEFEGCPCIYGIDLATKIDIAVVIRLFWRVEEDEKVHYYTFPTFFLPSERVESSKNSQYVGWSRQGLIEVTEGPITDLTYIKNFIIEDMKKYDVISCAYDPWQATQMAQELLSEGAPMYELSPTVLNFSEPMKQVQALVYSKRLHTDGNPVLEWMASNVVAHMDAKENIYPRKENNENKIDGIVALIMAMNLVIKKEVETYYINNNQQVDWSSFKFDL